MNTSFTLGPWHACCLNGNAHYVFGPVGDETICLMSHNDPKEFNYEKMSGIVTIEQRRANARLIAAAPELYAALNNLVARGLISTNGDHYDEAIEALNLATGQEP